MSPAARQARWDMGPVLAVWNGRSLRELAVHTGITYRNFVRWLRQGIPDHSADRLGTALGLGPEAIWPEWYDGTGSPEIVDHTAAGTVRDAYLRRVRSLASGRLKRPASQPHPDQEPAMPLDLPPAPRPRPLGPPIARSRGYSDDLVYIFPEWLTTSPNPPGLPPRKEDASCACSTRDEYGRRPIGWCGPDCGRRPPSASAPCTPFTAAPRRVSSRSVFDPIFGRNP